MTGCQPGNIERLSAEEETDAIIGFEARRLGDLSRAEEQLFTWKASTGRHACGGWRRVHLHRGEVLDRRKCPRRRPGPFAHTSRQGTRGRTRRSAAAAGEVVGALAAGCAVS